MVKALILVATLGIFTSMSVHAGDVAAGKAKSEDCVGCHGLNGHSNNPNFPNLAGQKENYLAKAIKDYRDGKRQDAIMGTIVKELSDADVANLAAFYSSVK